jgi:hypothetical protein
VIQVVFQDISELILSSGSGNVTFITSKGEVRNSPLYYDLEKKDPSLFKRLNYAKEILVHMIQPTKPSPIELSEKENRMSRDGLTTTRSKGAASATRMNSLKSSSQQSNYQISGLITSRSKRTIEF